MSRHQPFDVTRFARESSPAARVADGKQKNWLDKRRPWRRWPTPSADLVADFEQWVREGYGLILLDPERVVSHLAACDLPEPGVYSRLQGDVKVRPVTPVLDTTYGVEFSLINDHGGPYLRVGVRATWAGPFPWVVLYRRLRGRPTGYDDHITITLPR